MGGELSTPTIALYKGVDVAVKPPTIALYDVAGGVVATLTISLYEDVLGATESPKILHCTKRWEGQFPCPQLH